MSSASACRAAVRRAGRHPLIKAGLLVCLGVFVLSGCGEEAVPMQQRLGSARRTAPGELSVAMAMGRSVVAYPDTRRGASSAQMAQAQMAQTDERNQTDALVLFTSMRKARVLHGLH